MRVDLRDSIQHHSYFAICAIVKNEDYLSEWIEYHRRLGCGKFYLFDDNSSVPLIGSIDKYVKSGLVDYNFGDFSYLMKPQIMTYNLCLQNYRKRHRFIGFLDADEFIVIVNKTQKIPDVLRHYEPYGGVALQWKMFGSSGHQKRPEGGVLKNYNKCGSNIHIKTIANTDYVDRCASSVHEFYYRDRYFTVLTNHTKIKGCYNYGPPQYDVMYLNHYNVKSWEDFLRKVARGKANRNTPILDPKGYFAAVENKSTEDCGYLQMPPDL